MNIIGLNGSPRGRNSQTLRLVMKVLEGATDSGADIECIDLSKREINFCTGCGVCFVKGECINADDYPELLEKILYADGIVLGSPNYINNVTAQTKVVFDRMADVIHCQMLSGKYGCSVSTAGGSGAEEVAAYLNRSLQQMGVTTVGLVGVNILGNPEAITNSEKEAYELGTVLADAIINAEEFPEQEKLHKERAEYMKNLVLKNKDIWTHEYEFWKETGEIN
ncbi:MAG: flavodoxin family protein [Methanomicrobiales archaeon]|nr:flavodoxin family protein [Methanomicrobiales archaeon]